MVVNESQRSSIAGDWARNLGVLSRSLSRSLSQGISIAFAIRSVDLSVRLISLDPLRADGTAA